MMYKSPITINYINELTNQIIEHINGEIVARVSEVMEIDIDKKELEKALLYDRNQYEKGYAIGKTDGYASGYKERDAELVRCRECKHFMQMSEEGGECDLYYQSHWINFFCADGE